MRLLWCILFLCTVVATVAFAATDAPLSQTGALTSEDRVALINAKILVQLTEVPDSSTKKAVAVALVDASPEAVFSVLTDYAYFTSFMPYCSKVEVKEKKDEVSTVAFVLDFPWPIGDRHYTLRLTDQKKEIDGKTVYTSSWTYVAGSGNIKDSTGSWEVQAYDDKRTFVRYTVFTDPGGSIPAWANNAASEVAVPKVINGLRARVAEVAKEAASKPDAKKP